MDLTLGDAEVVWEVLDQGECGWSVEQHFSTSMPIRMLLSGVGPGSLIPGQLGGHVALQVQGPQPVQ